MIRWTLDQVYPAFIQNATKIQGQVMKDQREMTYSYDCQT